MYLSSAAGCALKKSVFRICCHVLGFVFQYHACVCAQLCLWTVAHQTPLSMGFSRQEYWSVSLSPPGDLPNPGMSPMTLNLQADSL